jgi:hypothetical protein
MYPAVRSDNFQTCKKIGPEFLRQDLKLQTVVRSSCRQFMSSVMMMDSFT